MLDNAKTFLEYKLTSMNEEIGRVTEFYFDDRHWTIRYLAAETGPWLAGRQVLISPHAVNAVSRERQRMVLGVTKRQIENAPSFDVEPPAPPQFENAYPAFDGWGWAGQVRRTSDINGAYVETAGGEMGRVEDLVIESDTWAIRYLVVDGENWWPGKRVLVSTQWIQRVMWDRREISVSLSRDAIRQALEYAQHLLPTREHDTGLHRHGAHPRCWLDEPGAAGNLQ